MKTPFKPDKSMFYYKCKDGALIVSTYDSPSLRPWRITYFGYLKLLKIYSQSKIN